MPDLPTTWLGLICIALLAYVVLDGFDLGIGILFPLGRDASERDRMMNTVAPVWDGNETWLVLGGGGLFAAFPLAYSILLTAFYAPVIAMLLSLVLRGVAFEFRFRTERWQRVWDLAFSGGSTSAAFFQGVMVGAFVQGIEVSDGAYAGGWFDWLSPFSVLCGVALAAGYALLGASWLVIKTDGALHARMRTLQLPLGGAVVLLIALVSVGTLFVSAAVRERWFTLGTFWFLWVVPAGTTLLAVTFFRAVRAGREILPFVLALGLFAAAFAGFAGSLYPWMIPPGITYYEAANADKSLAFMLVGALVLLPVILAYTGYSYWVFRGKVDAHGGYH
ncbi:MAG: cytochrome d ubiquinol oxidase subunit II [Gammaproteobacteria bacterium]|nr:cytochrome d ubiquinol oxidase subunit II [Gammaproteobacteria bacterium]MCB1745615.1 cytochrome d ubiquinol oxidase subunit II [Gammaproteobacteria bacterium]